MNLNQQTSDSHHLLLQKRERRVSENLKIPRIEMGTNFKEETEITKPYTKNSDNKNLSNTGKNLQLETKNNQEFNIIPPTIKMSNSRKVSLNSTDSRITCNCKNSQCFKLYCECFSTMSYCDPKLCSCKNCMNTVENEVRHFIKFKN
jgi:hypothetical protein